MDWITAIVTLALFVVALFYWSPGSKLKNLPPGPKPYPFIGNVLSFGRRPAITMTKWTKQYGDIFSIRVGKDLMVILGDINTAKRIYADDTVTGRPLNESLRPSNGELPPESGLIHSNGDLWKTHRRFALSTLRDLGMGKNWLEDLIVVEVEELCRFLREAKGKPINPKPQLSMSVANVICALTWGQRFALDDPKFRRMTSLFGENIQAGRLDPLLKTFPFLMWFPNPVSNFIKRYRKNRHDLTQFMKEIVTEFGEKNVDRGADDVQDYLQAYRREQETGSKTGAKSTFNETQLLTSMLDLFGAGTETTATTTTWAFVFMFENPDVLKKVHAEIDSNVGRNKVLRNEDRSQLPYTEATILEIQRLGGLVPLGGRVNFEEVTIDGYTIPKNTMIGVNLYSIHRDARWWKNPDQFDPTRFLDADGKLTKPEGFAPFSVGKRACLGESLAKMELFLFIANIFRCFELTLPPGKVVTRDDYVAANVHSPYPFEMIFIPRENT